MAVAIKMRGLQVDENRPSPEGLLNEIKKSENRRGKLKVFFGYSAGVGKTYAMLEEAQKLLRSGVDVVAGYIEPHVRPETARLLTGLPQLAPQIIRYKNIELKEFDLDAALKRKPQLILVDELAHTNAAGTRNKKRFQDIEELLNAGIDVFTTVNVQHIESLNNIVGDITKIAVNETVPDYIFDRSDQVKIIDVEPDELLQRFEEGKIYRPERAAAAMNNFFTKDNLRLLREIAMRKAADRISHENQQNVSQMSEKTAGSKLLVCVSSSPSSAKCIRWAARTAEAFFIPWVAVYVETKDQDDLTEEQKKFKRSNLALAERLGAEIITLSGVDIGVVIAEYAKLSGITNIVVGKSGSRKLFKTDLEDRLMALLPNVEIHVIPDQLTTNYRNKRRRWRDNINLNFSRGDSAKTALLIALATAIAFTLKTFHIGDQNIIMVYILAVLMISRVTNRRVYGIVASVICVLLFNFFYTAPYHSFSAIAPGYPITFVIMLAVALITSTLTARVNTQAKLAVKREQRTETLYEINRKLLVTRGVGNIISQANEYIVKLFQRSVIFYTNPERQSRGIVLQMEGEDADFLLQEDEKAVANWSFINQKQAGAGTDTLMGAGAFYMPVVSQGKSLGVIGLSCERGNLSHNSKFFLQTIVSLVAMALERQVLSDVQRKTVVSTEKEKMRNSLLSAVANDLRTPLVGILDASSAVSENFDSLTKEERDQIIGNIKDDSGWLIRMVDNLLSVTRIAEDGVNLVKTPEAVKEVVAKSVRVIRKRFPAANVRVSKSGESSSDEALVVPMDGVLIGQVLVNLIENSIKYSKGGKAINVLAKKRDRSVLFEVEDSGTAVPPEDLPHLFDFDGFSSAKINADSPRGFEIGLSVCKSIVDAHGGKIYAANNAKGGVTFSFLLPLQTETN